MWICKGEVYGKRDLAPSFTNPQPGHGGRREGGRERRDGRLMLVVADVGVIANV